MKSKLLGISALSVLGAFAPIYANATNLYDPTVSTTTVLDGSSIQLNGSIRDIGAAMPWTVELYAASGECVRFFITSTDFDSKITVIAPNGSVYRDDDSGGSLRPLVKIANAPVTGWYTVQDAHYTGAPTSANFSLLYGRYNAGNINCSGGTNPVSSGVEASDYKSKSVAPVVAPKAVDAP